MSGKIQRKASFFKNRAKGAGPRFWLILLIGLLCLIYGSLFLIPVVPQKPNVDQETLFKVKINPQSGLSSIGNQLREQGLYVNPLVIQLGARSLLVGSKLKPGTYLLPTGASLGKILLKIARGDRVRESIAIIPGMTIWQLRNIVDSHAAINHLTKGMSNQELLRSLNLSYPSVEGIFLPETYIFDPEESDIVIYRRAAQGMQKQLNEIWDKRESALPLKSPYELLVLASIVEKETGRASDRDLVATVFINRLNQNMPLQTDPTVIYGIGPKFDGNLRKADLRRDTPYNTYMRKGLPPSPIAMPSKESMLAVAHPAKSNALFFVAKGDGSSHFSDNLKEHESAVDRYQRKIYPKNTVN